MATDPSWIIGVIMFVGIAAVIIWPKKANTQIIDRMTAQERLSYEQRRGQLIAEKQMRTR